MACSITNTLVCSDAFIKSTLGHSNVATLQTARAFVLVNNVRTHDWWEGVLKFKKGPNGFWVGENGKELNERKE